MTTKTACLYSLFFVQPHVSYITNHSTDSHKCVYEVPGVGSPDLSNPAACPDILGILETGLHTYWQMASWEKHSPSSQCQSLTINRQPTEANCHGELLTEGPLYPRRRSWSVCVYACKHTGVCVTSRMLRYYHNAPFLSASKLLWLLKRMKGEWVIHPAWNFSTAHNKSSTNTDTV